MDVTAFVPFLTTSWNPASIFTGQIKIASTGVPVALPSQSLVNGIVVKAKTTNAANGFVGFVGVTTTDDGTGNGYRLLPGEACSLGVQNASSVWVNGTAGDVYYYSGN